MTSSLNKSLKLLFYLKNLIIGLDWPLKLKKYDPTLFSILNTFIFRSKCPRMHLSMTFGTFFPIPQFCPFTVLRLSSARRRQKVDLFSFFLSVLSHQVEKEFTQGDHPTSFLLRQSSYEVYTFACLVDPSLCTKINFFHFEEELGRATYFLQVSSM